MVTFIAFFSVIKKVQILPGIPYTARWMVVESSNGFRVIHGSCTDKDLHDNTCLCKLMVHLDILH